MFAIIGNINVRFLNSLERKEITKLRFIFHTVIKFLIECMKNFSKLKKKKIILFI